MMTPYIAVAISFLLIVLMTGWRKWWSFVIAPVCTLLILISVETARGLPTFWMPFPEEAVIYSHTPPDLTVAAPRASPRSIRLYTYVLTEEEARALSEAKGQPVISMEGRVFNYQELIEKD